MDLNQRILELEEEIRTTPYHKGTEHYVGKLRARIAKLKDEILEKKMKGSGGGGQGFAVKKTGNATVVLVGPPSVGKSTLLNALTNAQSKVAAYDFTTLNVIPGMLDYQGVKIQVFDVPGVISGASSGKGRGKEVLSVVRTADLILILVDPKTINKVEELKTELMAFGMRLNESKPLISVVKRLSGGIKIGSLVKQTKISFETVKEIAQEYRIKNADIVLKEDFTVERLIDAFAANRRYLPSLIVLNKTDLIANKPVLKDDFILISAKNKENLEDLKRIIWENLNLIRIYLKKKKGEVDFEEPLIVGKGQTLKEILSKLPYWQDERFISAKISGPGAKFPDQQVSLTFIPQEGTIVTFLK